MLIAAREPILMGYEVWRFNSQALAKLQAMAMDVMKAHGEKIVPEKITSCAEAYQAFTHGKSAQKLEAIQFVRQALSEHEGEFYVKGDFRVKEREETSYAAAILCQTGQGDDLPRAIRATNWITKQFNSEGCLYSTVDSRAAIALFVSLQRAGVFASLSDYFVNRVVEGAQEVKINGTAMTVEEAQKYPFPIEEVECISGFTIVEAFVEREENWSECKQTFPVSVELHKGDNLRGAKSRQAGPQQRFKAGDLLELVVKVDSYQPGLIAEVSLPACLVYLKAGAQLKRLSIDFAGEREVRIPLVAVAQTLDKAGKIGSQHFAVFVRNMFQEEIISNPGDLYVQVL